MTRFTHGTMGRMRWASGAAVLAVALTGLASCGDDDNTTTDRAGGDQPVTLRIGSPDVPGRPGAQQVEELARRVAELSDGDLLIEPSWGPEPGHGVDDWDQLAAQRVIDGEVDLALVPARAWDVLGVTTLRALNAPFVITDDESLAAVLHDEVVDDLLAGLEEADVTGLALYPEGMRRLFLVGDEADSLDDLEGRSVRAARSDTVYAFFEALGANPDDYSDDPEVEDAAIAEGSLVAFESSFANAPAIGLPTTAVGNVALFPKVNVLVANPDSLAELSDEHRSILRDAADDTLEWAVDQIPSEVEGAEQYCREGGRVVMDESAAAALEEAAAAVLEELEGDAETAALIEQVRSAAEDVAVAPAVEPCQAPGEDGTVRAEGPFPDGVYRADITFDSLIDVGVNETEATGHAGLWTLDFTDGVLVVSDVNDATGAASEGEGLYCVEEGRIVLGLLGDPPECGDFWNAAWEAEGDQLTFVDVVSDHGSQVLIEALFGRTWTRIG